MGAPAAYWRVRFRHRVVQVDRSNRAFDLDRLGKDGTALARRFASPRVQTPRDATTVTGTSAATSLVDASGSPRPCKRSHLNSRFVFMRSPSWSRGGGLRRLPGVPGRQNRASPFNAARVFFPRLVLRASSGNLSHPPRRLRSQPVFYSGAIGSPAAPEPWSQLGSNTRSPSTENEYGPRCALSRYSGGLGPKRASHYRSKSSLPRARLVALPVSRYATGFAARRACDRSPRSGPAIRSTPRR